MFVFMLTAKAYKSFCPLFWEVGEESQTPALFFVKKRGKKLLIETILLSQKQTKNIIKGITKIIALVLLSSQITINSFFINDINLFNILFLAYAGIFYALCPLSLLPTYIVTFSILLIFQVCTCFFIDDKK